MDILKALKRHQISFMEKYTEDDRKLSVYD